MAAGLTTVEVAAVVAACPGDRARERERERERERKREREKERERERASYLYKAIYGLHTEFWSNSEHSPCKLYWDQTLQDAPNSRF